MVLGRRLLLHHTTPLLLMCLMSPLDRIRLHGPIHIFCGLCPLSRSESKCTSGGVAWLFRLNTFRSSVVFGGFGLEHVDNIQYTTSVGLELQ